MEAYVRKMSLVGVLLATIQRGDCGKCVNNVCLVGGSRENEGNVEIGRKGVCDDSWGMEDAFVVCRQLGFPGVVRFAREAEFGNARRIGYDDFECRGTETRIQDCEHTTQHDCSSNEAAGVVCATSVSDIVPSQCRAVGKVCLIGGSNERSGNVYFEGRAVCDNSWSYAAAFVVCKQLNLGNPENVTKGGVFGNCMDYFSMYSIDCSGTEVEIAKCQYETDSRTCRHNAVAGVVCGPGPGLQNTSGSATGVWIGVGLVLTVVAAVGSLFVYRRITNRSSVTLLRNPDQM